MDETMDEVAERIEMLVGMLGVALKNKKLFKVMAKSSKKYYDALCEAGFTKAEAILIVANRGQIVSN